jgi:predicted nucleic acid-binding protein
LNVYYLDSSALVKRYVTETGSPWLRAELYASARNPVVIARITWVEVLTALARRQREGTLARQDLLEVVRQLRHHLDTQYQVVELDGPLTERAGELVMRHPLRAYDAVQLAAAMQVYEDLARAQGLVLVFLSADDRLLSAAQTEGLSTDNPNHHP